MIEVNKEQIEEVIMRLADCGHWMYYCEDSQEKLKKQIVSHKDINFSLDVRKEDGAIKITLENGMECFYHVMVINEACYQNTLLNLRFQACILNEKEIHPDYLEYFKELTAFVCSYFQRTIVFTFFRQMHKDTLDRIVNDLSLVK